MNLALLIYTNCMQQRITLPPGGSGPGEGVRDEVMVTADEATVAEGIAEAKKM